jgi:multimeric flavodoxin WrbA
MTDLTTVNIHRHFAFVLGSARVGGNSETLARHAAEHLPTGTTCTWLDLTSPDLRLDPFNDYRHDPERHTYPYPTGPGKALLEATLAATDLVIVSPLYWYSVSADVKLYMDHWTGWIRTPGVDFKARMGGKRMWGVTVMSDEDPTLAEPLVGTLRITADYLKMPFGGVLLGYGNRPDDVLRNQETLNRAKTFFHY